MSGKEKPDSIRAWFEANWKKYPDRVSRIQACQQETRKSIETIKEIYRVVAKKVDLPVGKNGQKIPAGLTEEQLRAKHDVLFMIKQGIKKLCPGVFPTESEFICDYARVTGKSNVRSILDMPEFEKYKGRAGSTIYWGMPEAIRKLKEDHVLG